MENKELEKKNVPMELEDDALDTVTGGLTTGSGCFEELGETSPHTEVIFSKPQGAGMMEMPSAERDSLIYVPRTETNEKTGMDKLLEIQNSQ